MGSTPELGRSPGERKGPLQYSGLGYSPRGCKEADMTEGLLLLLLLLTRFSRVQPHRRQPTRLPRPWDSPGKNTGVGCHFLLQCIKVKSESEVASHVRLFAAPWTAAYQTPPFVGFSRQECWSGVSSPSPRCHIVGII